MLLQFGHKKGPGDTDT